MDDESIKQRKIEHIRSFKNPVVFLNEIDFNCLKEYLGCENEDEQFHLNGVPIRKGNVKEGTTVIIDNQPITHNLKMTCDLTTWKMHDFNNNIK